MNVDKFRSIFHGETFFFLTNDKVHYAYNHNLGRKIMISFDLELMIRDNHTSPNAIISDLDGNFDIVLLPRNRELIYYLLIRKSDNQG